MNYEENYARVVDLVESYIESALQNAEFLLEFGLSSRNQVLEKLVVITASDVIHPDLGYNYISRQKVDSDIPLTASERRQLELRNRRCEEIVDWIVCLLQTGMEVCVVAGQLKEVQRFPAVILVPSIEAARGQLTPEVLHSIISLSGESVERIPRGLCFTLGHGGHYSSFTLNQFEY